MYAAGFVGCGLSRRALNQPPEPLGGAPARAKRGSTGWSGSNGVKSEFRTRCWRRRCLQSSLLAPVTRTAAPVFSVGVRAAEQLRRRTRRWGGILSLWRHRHLLAGDDGRSLPSAVKAPGRPRPGYPLMAFERPGIGVRLPPEWVFGLLRNRCSTWPGARNLLSHLPAALGSQCRPSGHGRID